MTTTMIVLAVLAAAVMLWPANNPLPTRPPLLPVGPKAPKPANVISHVDALLALSSIRNRLATTGGVSKEDADVLEEMAVMLMRRSEK